MKSQSSEAVKVAITEGFWTSVTETTQLQFKAAMGGAPWENFRRQNGAGIGSRFAANFVTHSGAGNYCEKLTALQRASGQLDRNWKYFLPTAAQWEYAYRAGTRTSFSFGSRPQDLKDHAWYIDDETYVHDVRRKRFF